jgi:predicted acetyltransferase
MGQWFGGRPVRMTGISAVGIEPAERARGSGTEFMRAVLEELRASDVPLSTLYPATQTIYRRCGYELAGDFVHYRLDADHIDVRDRKLDVELTDDRDTIKAIYGAFAARTSGMLDRSDEWWNRVFEPWKRDVSIYVARGDTGPEGYILYWRDDGEPRDRMVAEVIALTASARRRILTFAADHRSFIGSFEWVGPPAEPTRFFLSEPRVAVHRSWPWMLRLVDVSAALTERGYAQAVDAELHLDVTDDVLPANSGRFVLRVCGGKAEVQSGGDGALRIDVRALAPLYTGYMSAHELLATGYVQGDEQSLLAADAIFGGPAPWLADFF